MSVVDDLFDVRGRVALVTGGASGLGYAFASILADCGAVVVVADWNAERLEKAVAALSGDSGAAVTGARLDVADAAATRALVDGIVAEHGRIDIAFANAGIARGRPPLLPEGWLDDMDMDDYNALIDVNLHGVVYTVQAAAAHMKRRRSGSIVTTASTAGLRKRPVHAVLVHDRQGRRDQLHQAGRPRPGPMERAGERDRAGAVQDESGWRRPDLTRGRG